MPSKGYDTAGISGQHRIADNLESECDATRTVSEDALAHSHPRIDFGTFVWQRRRGRMVAILAVDDLQNSAVAIGAINSRSIDDAPQVLRVRNLDALLLLDRRSQDVRMNRQMGLLDL